MNARILNEPIPMLPPHYGMRLFLDSGPARAAASELEDRYDATVRYHDGRGHSWDEVYRLDLGIRTGMTYLTVYGMHHAAKALRGIEKSVKVMERKAGQVEATIETREERDARQAEARAEQERLLARFEAQQRAAAESPESPDAGPPA